MLSLKEWLVKLGINNISNKTYDFIEKEILSLHNKMLHENPEQKDNEYVYEKKVIKILLQCTIPKLMDKL